MHAVKKKAFLVSTCSVHNSPCSHVSEIKNKGTIEDCVTIQFHQISQARDDMQSVCLSDQRLCEVNPSGQRACSTGESYRCLHGHMGTCRVSITSVLYQDMDTTAGLHFLKGRRSISAIHIECTRHLAILYIYVYDFDP